MKEETARKAAKWWTNFLREGAKLDHGADSFEGAVAMGLGKMIQKNIMTTYTPEKIQMFEDALCELLMTTDFIIRHFYLGVDYHPCKVLHDASKVAGIEVDGVLPWKTQMWIEEDGVIKVSYGYRGEITII